MCAKKRGISFSNKYRSNVMYFSEIEVISCCSRTSKGFSSSNTMKSCGCVAVYTDTLQVFLRALDTPVHRPMLHAGQSRDKIIKPLTNNSLCYGCVVTNLIGRESKYSRP